ncbi:MAG: TonB-dependent receptor [Pyrinomonadaceae bacterium]|nr:TonB-dependent receptor [Pyrinomonadaceae bacterium]
MKSESDSLPKDTSVRAMFHLSILAITLASTAGLALAQAPDDLASKSLEDLMNIEVASVYSASKYSQKVTEAPSSVSIVTSEQIQRYGYRTLADILKSVRGFYVTNDRNYSYVGVRGFSRPGDYNTRVLLLVDGHRMNDNVYDNAPIGREFPVDVDLIERVEIVRGSSSSLYGTSAFMAVINVITKRGRDVGGVEVSAEGASAGTYNGRFSYGNKLGNDFEMLLSGSYYDSRGKREIYYQEFDTPATNNGIALDLDGEESKTFLANLSFRDFTLHGTYGSRQKAYPTASYGTVFNDPRARTSDRRGYLDLQYTHTFSNQLGLLARASYDSYRYDGAYVYDYSDNSTPLLAVGVDSSRGSWLSGELQLTKTVSRHRLTFGTEYRDNLKQNQGNYDLETLVVSLDDRRKSKNFGLFLQDEFVIRENLTLSAGVRYDHHTTYGGTTNPRVALIYHPAEKTTVKVLYGAAFRAPNNFELFYESGDAFNANPTLRPETIKTGELVFEKYLGDHVRVSASGFVYRIKGLISQQINPESDLITFGNVAGARSKGLEFEFDSRFGPGFEGNVSYTLQKTQDEATKETLTNSPRHLGKLNVIAPLFKRRVFAGFELQYTSQRRTLVGLDTPAFVLSNLTLFGPKLAKGLDASFGVYNLFNQKYGDPGGEEHRQNAIEQDGRTVRVKLTYHF